MKNIAALRKSRSALTKRKEKAMENNEAPKKSSVFDPCIGVCSMDKNGVCEGCCRTRPEIDGWEKMDDAEKRKVLEQCRKRDEDRF